MNTHRDDILIKKFTGNMKCYEYTICADYCGESFVGMAYSPEHFFELLHADLCKDWDENLEGVKPEPDFDIKNLTEIPLGSFSQSSWESH